MTLTRGFLALIGHIVCIGTYFITGMIIIAGAMTIQSKPDFGPTLLGAVVVCFLTACTHLILSKPKTLLTRWDLGWAIYLPIFFVIVLGVGMANVAFLARLMPQQPSIAFVIVAIEVVIGFIILKSLVDYHMAND